MRFRFTILLVLLNLTLVVALILLEKEQSSDDIFSDRNRILIGASQVAGFDRIEITGSLLDEDWTLTREEDNWLVESPVAWRANPYAIERILNQLRTLRWETRFFPEDLAATGRELKDYGLAEPRLTLRLQSGGSEKFRIGFGDVTEVGQRFYARLENKEAIYVLERGLLDSLVMDPGSLLDREVLKLPATQVRAVQVQQTGLRNLRIRLVREGDNWQFVSPIETPASREAMQDFLTRLDRLEVDAFLPAEEAPASLDSPTLRLNFESYQNRESLAMVATEENGDPGVYIRSDSFPTILKINEPLLDRFSRLQDTLRERRLLHRRDKTWTSLEIRVDNRATTLQRLEDQRWQVVRSDEEGNLQTFPAEESRIEELVELLEQLSVEQFVTDAPSEEDLLKFGLLQPQRTLTVQFEEGSPWELKIGNLAPDSLRLYASTNASPSVALIRPFILSQFPLSPLAYRDRTLRTLPESTEILSIELTRSGSDENLLQISETDTAEIRAALEALVRETRVARYHQASFEDPLALDRERELEWTLAVKARYILPGADPESPSESVFYLTDRIGGTTQFIGFPEMEMTGFLPQKLIELLEPVRAATRPPESLPAEVLEEEGD